MGKIAETPKSSARINASELSLLGYQELYLPTRLTFEQEIARKRKLLEVTAPHEADTSETFDVAPKKSSHEIQQSEINGFNKPKSSRKKDLDSANNYEAEIVKNENAEKSSLPGLNEKITNDTLTLDYSTTATFHNLPLDKLTTYIFICIFSSDFAQIFLKHHTEGDDLASLEFSLYKNPPPLNAIFESLYNLVNFRETELLERFTTKSHYFQRCENFRDFLRRLKSKITSLIVLPEIKYIRSLTSLMSEIKEFVPTKESALFFLRIGSNKSIPNSYRALDCSVNTLHLPVFNWLEKKFQENAFKGSKDSIKTLDSKLVTVARFYITSNRQLIENCLNNKHSVLLVVAELSTNSQLKHFILFVRPFGNLHNMEANSTGELDRYPKAWVWGKIVKCMMLTQDYNPPKRPAFRPFSLGSLKSPVSSHFKSLLKIYQDNV